MKVETKEIYKCEHCRKLYQIKNACIKHEIECRKNPDNFRACFGCIHMDKKDVGIFSDTFQGEIETKRMVLYCKKLESFMYPPKIERSKEWYETDPIENNPMPRTCEHRDDDYMKLI